MRNSFLRAVGLAFPLSLVACAPRYAGPPIRIHAGQPVNDPAAMMSRPLIIEFNEGDELPLAFSIDGDFIGTPPDLPPIRLRAKQHFYLRILRSDIKASVDGVHFDEKPKAPGSFRVGLGVYKDGVRAEFRIVTPRHAAAQ
jgi:hypothetical protein